VRRKHTNLLNSLSANLPAGANLGAPGTVVIPGIRCNTLQHTATHRNTPELGSPPVLLSSKVYAATHYNTLQHTATHANSVAPRTVVIPGICCTRLQHTTTHCNTLQHTATHAKSVAPRTVVIPGICCQTLQHTATHCNTLQHTATHCNTLQHTRTR